MPVTKVIYRPDQSNDEFIIIVEPELYNQWKGGDRAIPLVEIVDSFTVFHTNHGAQGILRQPSVQQLDTAFGTHKDVDVVTFILENGKIQQSDSIASSSGTTTNVTRGSVNTTHIKGFSGN